MEPLEFIYDYVDPNNNNNEFILDEIQNINREFDLFSFSNLFKEIKYETKSAIVNGYDSSIKIVICAGLIMAVAFAGLIPSSIETVEQVEDVIDSSIKPLKSDITFDLDSSLEKAQPAKEIVTITKMKRNIEKISGKEIAVNNKYICYSSKNKNIRVINQESGDLRFFKGHEQKITDIVVYISKNQNKSSLKAASIDSDNTLILWTEDNNKDFNKLLTIKGINNGSYRFQRILFHPSNENIFAVSTNTNKILLFDLRKNCLKLS